MAANIQETNFICGGKHFTHFYGQDEAGDAVDYIDQLELDEKEGLPVRYYPFETYFERDTIKKKGGIKNIRNIYKRGLLNPAGEIIEGTDQGQEEWLTGRIDINYFIPVLGIAIMKASANGLVRAKWGFVNKPVYKPDGTAAIYTEEQNNAPATNDYWAQTNP